MPPSGSNSNLSSAQFYRGFELIELEDPAQFYQGFELIELEDPAIPSASTFSANNNNSIIPQTPNNSFAAGQNQQSQVQQMNAEMIEGRFGGFLTCFPFTRLLNWNATTTQITNSQQPKDTEDSYEISLECIDVNFKQDYIGGGNQSSVFKGKWNGRFIALKKLNRASEVDIEKLVQLDHPNVVKTIGLCSKDIYPCIVMEFCEKGALFDLLSRTHIGKHQFLLWARNIASGMQYLHSLRIIHRDLKSPNVLVDKHGSLKICDFGSLYTWDKSYMGSTVMSCAGTSQWMSPEMLKQEPCSEKVDIWSYSVILWELLIQEVPYKNISSMAIMYGVGSDKLRLHLPKNLPDNLLLLMKVCFAKKPRNRPSFTSILNHLENLEVEIGSVNEDAWRMRKEVWKREVSEEAEKLRQNSMNGNDAKQLEQQQAEELIEKRMNELRHAEELRQMYQLKMLRADKLTEILNTRLQDVDQYERKIVEYENSMRLRAGTAPQFSTPPPVNKIASGSVPELKSVKVQKPTMIRAGRGQKATTDLYTRAGQHAIVTYQISDDDDLDNNNPKNDTEEELYESDAEEAERLANRSSDPNMCHTSSDHLPNIPNNTLSPPQTHERLIDGGQLNSRRRISHSSSISSSSDDEHFAARSRHSYGCNSHQNSFEECSGTKSKISSRATSARSSMNFAQRQLHADVRANRNSISHLPYEHADEQRPQLVCPCCAYEFHRNCTARISGISADSGVASTMDERQMSALTLETTGDECICGANSQKYECHGTDLYRNQYARWSDGRIHRHHHRNNTSTNPSANHTPISRNTHHRSNRRPTANSSFTRNSPARRVASASTNPKRTRSSLNRNSTGCLDSALANEQTLCNHMPMSTGDVRRSPSSSTHSSNSQPRLLNKKDVEDEEMPEAEPQMVESGSGLFMNYQRRHDAIQEMDSSMSSKSNRSPKKSALMDHSSSTMASSLERSLELGIADGLTDKEDKLRAVKISFRTHRRCASNPTNVVTGISGISRIAETSTESDNDPVYC